MHEQSPDSAPELVLTPYAADRLHALLEESGDTGCRIRIEVLGPADDPAYVFSIEAEADAGDVELDFVRIGVVLDPESRGLLRGRELDYRNDADGERFVIRRGG